jgi:hypothetical protein
LAVHFDVDLVDFLDAPPAENTDRGIAKSLTGCGEALSELPPTHARTLRSGSTPPCSTQPCWTRLSRMSRLRLPVDV